MKRSFALLFALILITGLVACGGDAETPAPVENPDEDSNDVIVNSSGDLFEGDNWSMEIAEGWTIMEVMGFTVLAAPGGDGSNVNVVVESMQGMSLDDYIEASLDMIETVFSGVEITSSEHIYVNGKNAMFVAYTSDFPGVHTTYQVTVEAGGMAYIITYTRMGETDYLDEVFTMLETFVVVSK